MAAGDAPGRQLGTLLVASLTLLLPLFALSWSIAGVAPPLVTQPSRVVVIAPTLPGGATAPDVAAPVDANAAVHAASGADDEADASVAASAAASPSDESAIPAGAVAEAAPAASPVVAAVPVLVPTAPVLARAIPTATATPTPSAEAWTREASFNFIAVGVDQRSDGELTRTDTLMLGNIDVVKRRLSVVSIPRDLVVDIPDYGFDRINTAYVYGEQFKETDGGIGLLKRTIERNFGIPVQHYGLIDFNCFRTAIDAVGGVTVDVPREIDDPYYPTDDYGVKRVHFDVGPQRMNGERALEYARTRNADNDFHRIRRQQLIAASLRAELLSLRSLPAVPSILGGCRNLRSDLGWRDYLALASVVRNLGDGDVSFHAIDERMAVGTTLATGAAVLLPRWEPIRALIRESFQGPRRPTTAGIPDGLTSVRGAGALDDRTSATNPVISDGPASVTSVSDMDGPQSVVPAGQPLHDGVIGAPVVGVPAITVPATN